jgi:four helix bundle protein
MGEKAIRTFRDLRVYQGAFDVAMQIYRVSKLFPKEECYSLTDQVRRSSRSVCANVAEAWRKRRYRAAFIAKLNESEAEACETQVWLEFARECGFIDTDLFDDLNRQYETILSQLVGIIHHADKWLINPKHK